MPAAGGLHRTSFERFMIGSSRSSDNATLHRWFGKFNSVAIELSMS
jgi:hypothetical protein